LLIKSRSIFISYQHPVVKMVIFTIYKVCRTIYR
jgi:hypothetical protein